MERMRARGFTPPADGQTPRPLARQRAEAEVRDRVSRTGTGRAPGTAAAAATPSATTFDALFGPLPPTETSVRSG